jgi:hypothetical protein
MDEMHGGASTLQRVLLILTHNRITRQTSRRSVRDVGSVWLENRFPHFGENALTMGRKKFQC